MLPGSGQPARDLSDRGGITTTKQIVLGIIFTILIGGLAMRAIWLWLTGQPSDPPDADIDEVWDRDGSGE